VKFVIHQIKTKTENTECFSDWIHGI